MLNISQKSNVQDSMIFLSKNHTKDESHRLSVYLKWISDEGVKWYSPDLATYRDYLLKDYNGRNGKPLSANSVRAHLATIRARYKKILRSNNVRDYFYMMLSDDISPSDRKSLVDEILQRIENSIDPAHSELRIITSQDLHDNAHIRLNSYQVQELLTLLNQTTLIGLRDKALISLFLCTGIREAELCALDVRDLSKQFGGELALHVRQGKGAKERLVPYGDLKWGLDHVLNWCNQAGIDDGSVFRGFYRGGKRIRRTRLTVRAVNQILDKYPIQLGGELRKLAPHDLRRTYARMAYESGMDLLGIRDNLGHSDTRTTLKYIGTMDIGIRKPKNIYNL